VSLRDVVELRTLQPSCFQVASVQRVDDLSAPTVEFGERGVAASVPVVSIG
jgi:hypothetical protein